MHRTHWAWQLFAWSVAAGAVAFAVTMMLLTLAASRDVPTLGQLHARRRRWVYGLAWIYGGSMAGSSAAWLAQPWIAVAFTAYVALYVVAMIVLFLLIRTGKLRRAGTRSS